MGQSEAYQGDTDQGEDPPAELAFTTTSRTLPDSTLMEAKARKALSYLSLTHRIVQVSPLNCPRKESLFPSIITISKSYFPEFSFSRFPFLRFSLSALVVSWVRVK